MTARRTRTGADEALLARYRQKRQSGRTPEPFGGVQTSTSSGYPQFMVHHHAATSTHYDLRLEMQGVLRSWAVPKGPSPNVAEKRFAALVEDHPLEYGNFEGHIPDGNYGAGWTIVWDKGFWVPLADPLQGLKSGKLLFELHGCKLHGKWTLVRMKGRNNSADKDWLLIKEADDHADPNASTKDYPAGSVFSGLTLAELDAGVRPGESVLRSLARSKNVLAGRQLTQYQPMLATRSQPFNRPGWLFEIKYDGYRLLCAKICDKARLLSRNGKDLTQTFPEIALAVSKLPYSDIVPDGEVVVLDRSGLPNFSAMQKRGRLTDANAIMETARRYPVTFYAFDLLVFGAHDLTDLALSKRKQYLSKLLPTPGLIRYSAHIEKDGVAMFQASVELGLEGIVGKKADSRYRAGRSEHWLKIRREHSDDFVIMGYKASGRDIRSVMVGQYVDGKLVYSGNVGSGLGGDMRKQLADKLGKLRTIKLPRGAPNEPDYVWKSAKLVCEVKFTEFTPAGHLRHPVLLRLRDDKSARACTRDFVNQELPEVEVQAPKIEKTFLLSNLDKVFWPQEGYTKGDMLRYYEAIAPWLLPWIKDRPLVLTRYPDGIEGKSFYQKDAPEFAPAWMQIEKRWSESTEREIGYFVANDVESLMYIANMASIPLHAHHSRCNTPELPDWCVLDLDPKDAPFSHVIQIARAIYALTQELGLPTFVKTSGSTGLHVLLPLNNQLTFEQSRVLGELLARIIVSRLPDIATIARNPRKRERKVYIDYLQNGHGKTIASAFCVRALPGAPVSMPLKWTEVNHKLTPDRFNISNAIARVKRWRKDPALEVLDAQVNLIEVLEALAAEYASLNQR